MHLLTCFVPKSILIANVLLLRNKNKTKRDRHLTGNPYSSKENNKSLQSFIFTPFESICTQRLQVCGRKVSRLCWMLQNPVILYSLQPRFSLNCKPYIFYLCNISLLANNVDFHHRLNPHFPFSLIGNVFPACDCILSNYETVWYFPTRNSSGGFEGGKQTFTYMEHGSILKLFLIQATARLTAAVATTNRQ